MNRISKILALGLCVTSLFLTRCIGDEQIDLVKNNTMIMGQGYPAGKDPHIARIGPALDALFKNGEWKYFISNGNQNIVQFTGDSRNVDENGRSQHVVIQFILRGNTFVLGPIEYNGQPSLELFNQAFIQKVLNAYQEQLRQQESK